MTSLEEILVNADNFLTDCGIPHFVHGSTLLGMIRNKRVLDREISGVIPVDREHNFGCYYRDITPEFLKRLRDTYPYVSTADGFRPNCLIWFGNHVPKDRHDGNGNLGPWEHPEGFNLLATYYSGPNYAIEDMTEDRGLVWPKEYIDRPMTWGRIEINGHVYNTPRHPAMWLDHYYGKDWVVEKRHWHWIDNSLNLMSIKELAEKGELREQ